VHGEKEAQAASGRQKGIYEVPPSNAVFLP
jgi:hypothetical protein